MNSPGPTPAEWPADAYVSSSPPPALRSGGRPDTDFASFLDFTDAPLIGAVSRHQLDLAGEYDVGLEVEPDADRPAPQTDEPIDPPQAS